MTELISFIQPHPPETNWSDGVTWSNWFRQEAYLRALPHWKNHQVDSVATESLKIVSRLADPRRHGPFQCRGLVVGYVQSGKTANYTAVAARAADAGYRLVIILSGIHDSLRNQTQVRLDRELVGTGINWTSLTSNGRDFSPPPNADGFDTTGPVLIVAKKIAPILARILDWLCSVDGRLPEIPLLLIDDEADQASINTSRNRQDIGIDEDEPGDDGDSPSRTNELIRAILRKFSKAAYVAYTATPFANILIDPMASDRVVGTDLFPKDFVLQLPRPEGYTGTEELFGDTAGGRDVMRPVPASDIRALKPARQRRSAPVSAGAQTQIPQTLCDAVLAFCVAGGVRALRGQSDKSHTMLVHVSQRQADQMRIADDIRRQIGGWRDQERMAPGSMVGLVRSAWQDVASFVSLPEGVSESELTETAIKILWQLEVLVLNSTTGEELNYDRRPGCHLIAVGGNRLSRGLTLEGLTITYFIRTTSMADTLLQMARWYGFREGYADLIRIWTTDGIAQWFVELALVEESLRVSIEALDQAGRRPDEMQIRMRAHAHLLLTSKAKSQMQTIADESWSSQHPQTILLPLSDDETLQQNLNLTDRFLADISMSQETHGGVIAYDVSPDMIVAYLRQFQTHTETVAFQADPLADWIMGRVAVGELTTWAVFVASPAGRKQVALGGRQYGLVHRSLNSSESIGILIEPRHEGVDLNGGPEAYLRPSGSYDAGAMRSDRPATQGLLLIYPLAPEHLNVDNVPAVIAIALSLPRTSDEGVAHVVNSGVPSD